MFKSSIRYALIYFVISTVWQLIIKREIEWGQNLGVCIIAFLFMLLFNWAKIPYEWKQDK